MMMGLLIEDLVVMAGPLFSIGSVTAAAAAAAASVVIADTVLLATAFRDIALDEDSICHLTLVTSHRLDGADQ